MNSHRMRASVAVPACLVVMVASAVLSLQHASYREITVSDVWAVVASKAFRLSVDLPDDQVVQTLVWQFGFPRVLLAALVGAGLAVAGVAAQALVRNPLADPFVLGTSGGATLGVVAALVWGVSLNGVVAPAAAASCGALAALMLVMILARHGRDGSAALRLILCGIAIGHMFVALSSFLILRRLDGNAANLEFWTTGSMEAAKLDKLWLPAVILLVGIGALLFDARRMNALLVGDETATSLGINVTRLRWRLILVTALLVGVMVSQSGIIGFVGLVIPHAARLLVGSDHRSVIPVTAAGGAAYMVFCDYVARAAVSPQFIPIGIVAGGIGAPAFLWLVGRRMTGRAA